jgi:hypothetical protein
VDGSERAAELERRLELLEAERQILACMYRYAHSMDYGPPEEWAACFTEDGTYETDFMDGTVDRYEGRAELRRKAAGRQATGQVMKHVMVNPMVTEVGATEARASAMYVLIEDRGDGPRVISCGRYLDHFVKDADGAWRFKSRRSEREASIAGLGVVPPR